MGQVPAARARPRAVRLSWILTLAPAVPAGLAAAFALPFHAAVTPVSGGLHTVATGAGGKCPPVAGTADGCLTTQVAGSTGTAAQLFGAVAQNSAGTTSNRPHLTDAQAANHTPQRQLAGADGWNPVGREG
jgi:hypothetical protein